MSVTFFVLLPNSLQQAAEVRGGAELDASRPIECLQTRGPRHTLPRLVRIAGKPGEPELCRLDVSSTVDWVLVVCNPGFGFQLADIYTIVNTQKSRRVPWASVELDTVEMRHNIMKLLTSSQ